ncbi:MAG: hypothetical protein H7144_02785 [Burkholderiales bacterium]|nr:hypothetical protein [Phycisphaerae bacterium]
MSMPKIAIVAGVLLSILGIAGAISSNMHGGKMITALIPFFVGDIFILLGVLSLAQPGLRKHLMHGLAMVALLGTIAAIVPMAIRWSLMKPMAQFSVVAMAIICAATLALCIKSFGDARRARGFNIDPNRT